MGLDMYLSKIPISQRVEDTDYENCEEVAYWRKFNALHNWFVQNCQNGVDQCQYAEVTQEQIQELQNLLEMLSPTNCEDLLPTQSGFFFGNTEYGEDYWSDVRETIETLGNRDIDWETEKLVYHSSW